MEVLSKYLDFLWNNFQHDMGVFSQPWMYYWLLIPAIGYFIFFILKWLLFTAPLWLPVSVIIRVMNFPPPKCETCSHKTAIDLEDKVVDKTAKIRKKFESTSPTSTSLMN